MDDMDDKTATRSLAMAAPVFEDEEVLRQVSEILRSGQLREGRYCREFEQQFAARVGAGHAVAVNSGTAALHVIYLALLQPGDEVLIPSFTFIATGSMLLAMGARPVFCDVDPRSFTLDPADVRRKITSRTRAVVPVHLFGNACDMDAMNALARENRLHVIGDAAQSHGTRYRGEDVGSFPDAVAFSFYPSKNMTTGEGGMITTSDEDLAERFRLLRSHGQTERYLHAMLGFNYRMTEVSAVLGLSQLRQLEEFIEKRRRNAAYLSEHLADCPGVALPHAEPEAFHTYSQYSVLLSGKLAQQRQALQQRLQSEGVPTAVYYPRPLHQQPVFSSLGSGPLPVTEDLADRILSLPVHPALRDEDLERIAASFRAAVAALV